MPMTEKQFKECLMLYGPSIEEWPEDLRIEAMQANYFTTLNHKVIEQQFFDEVLLSNRALEDPSANLADRIISASRTRVHAPRISLSAWVQEFLGSLLPKPAFALALTLMLGVGIGIGLPSISGDSDKDSYAQNYFDEDGTTL